MANNMDGSDGFCHRCSGCTVRDGVAGSVRSKEVVMLYDLERALQLLSGATLAGLPESNLSLEPADQSGKARFPLPELTARVDRFPLPVNTVMTTVI